MEKKGSDVAYCQPMCVCSLSLPLVWPETAENCTTVMEWVVSWNLHALNKLLNSILTERGEKESCG